MDLVQAVGEQLLLVFTVVVTQNFIAVCVIVLVTEHLVEFFLGGSQLLFVVRKCAFHNETD